MAVYQLGELLTALGHHVTYVPYSLQLFHEWKHTCPKRILEKFELDPSRTPVDSIAILPEITPEDLVRQISARRRAWYLLNKPYVLTGKPLFYRPDDLVVAYSGLISKACYNLFLTREISELAIGPNSLENLPKKEPLILFYFGKSRTTQVSRAVKTLIRKHKANVIAINRVFPQSRELLFDLLRKARLLISYDPLTNLNYEATLCGTPCYIADNYMKLKYEDYNIPLHGFFQDEQLLGKYYLEGIPPSVIKTIHEKYRSAQQESMRSVQGFVQLCADWFSFVADAETDPLKTQFLTQHNQLRLEMDRVAFELAGATHITEKLHSYTTTEFMTVFTRIKQRIDHIKYNFHRTWYKYFLRMHGAALDQKLSGMKAEYDKYALGLKW